MKIRKANLKDAERISHLISKTTEKVKENNYSKKQITAWKKANTPGEIKKQLKDRIIFCALENKKLLGTIALKKNEILGFYINYAYRGKGTGSKLLNRLEKYAKRKGVKKLILTSTPSACSFYRKKGYKTKGKVVLNIEGADFPETKMEKQLK